MYFFRHAKFEWILHKNCCKFEVHIYRLINLTNTWRQLYWCKNWKLQNLWKCWRRPHQENFFRKDRYQSVSENLAVSDEDCGGCGRCVPESLVALGILGACVNLPWNDEWGVLYTVALPVPGPQLLAVWLRYLCVFPRVCVMLSFCSTLMS